MSDIVKAIATHLATLATVHQRFMDGDAHGAYSLAREMHWVRPMQIKRRGRMVRGKLVELSGTVAVFECPARHRSTKDYSRGTVAKRIGADGLRLLSRYWRDGISYECKRCLDDAAREGGGE